MGDRQVKKERKELVRRVEQELARLDEMKEKAWEEQQTRTERVEAQGKSLPLLQDPVSLCSQSLTRTSRL